MNEVIAQIVLNPATVNWLLGCIVALLVWLVKRSFTLDKKISLIAQHLQLELDND